MLNEFKAIGVKPIMNIAILPTGHIQVSSGGNTASSKEIIIGDVLCPSTADAWETLTKRLNAVSLTTPTTGIVNTNAYRVGSMYGKLEFTVK